MLVWAVQLAAFVTVAVRVQSPGRVGVQVVDQGPAPLMGPSKGGGGVVPLWGTASTRKWV
ncbi:hypothetical protein D3C83_319160 [compost metagenome]